MGLKFTIAKTVPIFLEKTADSLYLCTRDYLTNTFIFTI